MFIPPYVKCKCPISYEFLMIKDDTMSVKWKSGQEVKYVL